jgi:hypothetical protein
MPSPFPGMDPYLEGHLWTSFHAHLATEIARQLVPRLRPKYIALPERKYLTGALEDVMITARSLVPDVGVRKAGRGSAAALGTAAPSAPVKLRSRLLTPVPHYRVEIRDALKRKLVTAIELLSPTNKRGGRREYLRKRRRFLRSSAHLLEVDLHHQGKRVPLLDPYPQGAYFVLLTRARNRSWTDVWPASIDQALPTVPVPLLKGDPDVSLDLQDALTKVYDEGGFDLMVDYRRPPDVDLTAVESDWLQQWLHEAGWR